MRKCRVQVENANPWTSLGPVFCKTLTQAFSETSTYAPWLTVVADRPFSPRPAAEVGMSFRFALEGSLEGHVYLLVKHTDLPLLGLLDTPADTGTVQDLSAATLLRALKQGMPHLSELLSEHGAMTVGVELVADSKLPDDHAIELWARSENGTARVSLYLCMDQALMTSLQISGAKAFAYPAATGTQPANLDLVLDVVLNVTLRFGQRQLSLREVLDLTSGSVVELDRQVDEPIELVLDGRVVARGEAVIIDGNYGMRVTQVLQPLLV